MRRCNEIVSEAISQRLMGYAFCIVNASHPKWTSVRIYVGGTSCMVLSISRFRCLLHRQMAKSGNKRCTDETSIHYHRNWEPYLIIILRLAPQWYDFVRAAIQDAFRVHLLRYWVVRTVAIITYYIFPFIRSLIFLMPTIFQNDRVQYTGKASVRTPYTANRDQVFGASIDSD